MVDPKTVLVDDFEGWGTSLCWWANVVGGYSNRDEYADLAFSYLQFNIVRYNIGGGENPGITDSREYRAQMDGFQPSPGVWDWNVDQNQRWMMKAAVARGVNRIEAFSNSPPWWMTVSGSVTGSVDGYSDNLEVSYEDEFADYLAEVVKNLAILDNVTFNTVCPMNEPSISWPYGNRQEGCHMSWSQQERMINLLRTELDNRGIGAGVTAPEDCYEQQTIDSVNSYGPTALGNLAQISTHTYWANNPFGLHDLAASLGKDLWHTEYGDDDASGMQAARRIHDDLMELRPKTWICWQVVDNWGGWGMIYNPLDGSGDTSYTIRQKFYVIGQFSKFIRPGYQIINNAGDNNTITAYDPVSQTLVIVALNEGNAAVDTTYDLSSFPSTGSTVERYRTSQSESLLQISDVSISGQSFSSSLARKSVTTHIISNVAPPLPGGVVDDIHQSITYYGPWGVFAGNPGYMGTEHFSETTGSSAVLGFTGTKVRYYGFKRSDLGYADILLDGQLVDTVDCYSPVSEYFVMLYESTELADEAHTLEVKVNGTKNPLSSGTEVIVDAFEYIDPNADFNGDTVVNFLDYAELADVWMRTAGEPDYDDFYDLYDDDVINTFDMRLLLQNWLQ